MVVEWVFLELVMSVFVEHPLYAGPCIRPGGVRVNKHHPAPTFRGAGPMESRGLPSMLASRWRTSQAPGSLRSASKKYDLKPQGESSGCICLASLWGGSDWEFPGAWMTAGGGSHQWCPPAAWW